MSTPTTTRQTIDPITLEVVRNRLDAIANEMQMTLLKSAFSSTIKEAWDASAAIFDRNGKTMAQAAALPAHLGMIVTAVERLVETFPPDTMAQGDVYTLNDPYDGGTHLPDICIMVPVFSCGRVVALAGSLAHHQDVGGAVPSSTSPDCTEIYQEGLVIPPLKLYDRGRPNETLMSLMERNTRLPETLMGDIRAQLACAYVGSRRLADLFDEYGEDTISTTVSDLMDYSERLTRAVIARLPDGRASFADYIDGCGGPDGPIKIQATVQICGDQVVVDFAGSSPQVRAAVNSVPSSTNAAVYFVVRGVTDPHLPNNAGCYRPITVKAPPGTIVNPLPPAAVAVRTITIKRIVDAVMGAFARLVPDRVHAASCGQIAVHWVGGIDPKTQRPYVSFVGAPTAGGMGARPTKDGIDVIDTDVTNLMNQPVEATELEFPLRVHYCRRWEDSGGPGLFRGGLGYQSLCELLRGEAVMTHRRDRIEFQPWGLLGGEPAPLSKTAVLRTNGARESLPARKVVWLDRGDRVLVHTAGGGGYGDPLERPPARVLADILDGSVSQEAARHAYGVVLVEGRLEVDEEGTAARRTEERDRRGPIHWTFDRGQGYVEQTGLPRRET